MMFKVLNIWLINSVLSGVAYPPVMAIAEQVNSTSSQSARHIHKSMGSSYGCLRTTSFGLRNSQW